MSDAPKFARRRKLTSPAPRRNSSYTAKSAGEAEIGWVWGKHAAAAALANPQRTVLKALATRNAARDLASDLAGRVDIVEPKVIDDALPHNAVHQGIAVECKRLEPVSLDDIIAAHGPVVVLDQVTDPQNVGAVIRSACAFGAAGLVMQDRKAPPLMGACAKAAVGAAERVPHARVVNISRAIDALTQADVFVIGLAGEAEADLTEALAAANSRRLALVIGAEDKGLRPSVSEACAMLARIPISAAVESLNVSTAAAVALYALTQRSGP